MATVSYPFKIIIHNIRDTEPIVEAAQTWFKLRRFKTEKVTAPWKVRGRIFFFSEGKGKIDQGRFVEVPLTAQYIGAWWYSFMWKRLELSGTIPNIGRYCFTGHGVVDMDVYDEVNNTVFCITGRVETTIVE